MRVLFGTDVPMVGEDDLLKILVVLVHIAFTHGDTLIGISDSDVFVAALLFQDDAMDVRLGSSVDVVHVSPDTSTFCASALSSSSLRRLVRKHSNSSSCLACEEMFKQCSLHFFSYSTPFEFYTACALAQEDQTSIAKHLHLLELEWILSEADAVWHSPNIFFSQLRSLLRMSRFQ